MSIAFFWRLSDICLFFQCHIDTAVLLGLINSKLDSDLIIQYNIFYLQSF